MAWRTGTSALAVEITFTTDRSALNVVSDENLWNSFLVERVATLAYLDGDPLASYRVIEVNPKGDYMTSSVQFLYPDQASKQLKANEVLPAIDDAATRDRLIERFHTYGLTTTLLSVTSGGAVRSNTQIVELHVTAPSLQEVNKVINILVPTVPLDVREANEDGDGRITVLRLKVFDANGTLLVHYVRDLETGIEMFAFARGVEANWFPHPAPVPPTPISPINSPLPPP